MWLSVVCSKFIFLHFLRFTFLLFVGVFHLLSFQGLEFFESYCVNLFLCWHSLVSSSMVIVNFAGYSSLACQLCSLRFCMTSAQDILAFIFSGEKSGVILIVLPLYVT